MKNTKFKQLITVVAFVGLLGTMSSCNRGYGCPTNFSINDGVSQAVTLVAKAVFK